jgi:hypothetical protein
MQGASWVSLLKGDAHDWRDAFMFEYLFERNLPATPAPVRFKNANPDYQHTGRSVRLGCGPTAQL